MRRRAPSAVPVAVVLVLAAAGCRGSSRAPVARAGAASSSEVARGAASTSAARRQVSCAPFVCGPVRVRGALAAREMDETSGLAASAVHAGVFYAHNDSGDVPRFFAIEPSGVLRGTFDVAPARAVDWEDIARGPCAGPGSCLYLADIGDNREQRASYAIYRVAEPAELGPGSHRVEAEALPFSYPDGSHNAETLLVHPTTGVVTIVTKVALGASSIYELPMPLTPGAEVVAKKVGELTAPVGGSVRFTGGDVHPAGTGVLLRTYTSVLYYAMAPGRSVAEALLGAPCRLPAPDELQGEAIAWLPKGDGYLTTSEGIGADVHEVDCAPGAP
jgi:hypothetical protein